MDEEEFEDLMEIQRMMASKLAEEEEVDKKVDVLNLIRNMTDNGDKDIQTESIIVRCTQKGMSEQQILDILDELEKDRIITYPTRGYVTLK